MSSVGQKKIAKILRFCGKNKALVVKRMVILGKSRLTQFLINVIILTYPLGKGVGVLINTAVSYSFYPDKNFDWNEILKKSKVCDFVDCDPYGSWPWGTWELPGIAKFVEVRDLHMRVILCHKQDLSQAEEKLSLAVSEFFTCKADVQIKLDQNLVNVKLQPDLRRSLTQAPIGYYEFPNGEILKNAPDNDIYQFNPVTKKWNINVSLSSLSAYDKSHGKPCENLRQKADISRFLPPFPSESAFYPGNTVMIGAYPQKSLYDYSPIPWIVLQTTDTTALCMAKDCLITTGYCDPQKAYGKPELLWWENSLAREVCNQHFYNTAFSKAEKARIIPREMNEVQLGAKCTDSVFLLSEREVLHYFPLTYQRKAKPTPYATQNGASLGWRDEGRDYTSWWLLPEENAYGYQGGSIYPKAVFYPGGIQFHGRNIYHTDFTIRPCIQIKYTND